MLDKRRIRRFHAALSAANLQSQKVNLLSGYGVESTKDLTPEQADELIARLTDIGKSKKKDAPKPIRQHRSIVMTLINELGIYATNGDWKRVNKFLLNPRIAGKLLYEMDLTELKKLQKKLRVMIKNRKAEKQEVKETNN